MGPSPLSLDAAIAEALAPRDGPTEAFRRHHDTTARSSGIGVRRWTRLEQWAVAKRVTPAESEAGRRFAKDYLVCFGGGRSCLDPGPRVSGWSSPSGGREDAARDYGDAARALNGAKVNPGAPGVAPADLLMMFCVEDRPPSELAGVLGVGVRRATTVIIECLGALAAHYADVDRRRGRSTTAQTHEAAVRKYDPDAKAPPPQPR